ncbi:uncharacterized protein SAPINGB_P000858 [Magnusiomyces paraingens]|uniref:DNA topoisomerase I n=1 Tax=Magnusiomyces paraingens TaxID=2606893 RepID=A0A5E8B4H9_9ASCO|nr:uncharacterized protein SAPINGB_P000858 [Saprochaete ingens]VVT45722.1 unnamed protein product [Saprochaete ingens]
MSVTVKSERQSTQIDVKNASASVAETKKRKSTPSTNGRSKKVKTEDEDKKPASAKKKETVPTKTKSTASNGKSKPATTKKSTPKTKASPKAANTPKKEESEDLDDYPEDDEEEEYKWWEQSEDTDNSIKWTTLSHNGVLFPPEYVPLPKNIHLIYDGKAVSLPPEAEEVAGFFGAMVETDHAQNPVFQKNFFNDFVAVLKETKQPALDKQTNTPVRIQSFEKCDFTVMHNYFSAEREKKRNLPSSEKKRIKAERDDLEAPYKFAFLDGRKEALGNFRIEPPGLFRGRGAHPKTGKLKRRVKPEDITINIGKEAKIPEPPSGHKWAEVKHDNTVAWLATWRENINGATKYVMLAATSSLKGMSDFKKFEKARELKNHINRIRKDYVKELKDPTMLARQRATATYLIDVLALRAGGEKGEDEADTVGCCSLRYEHVSLKPPNIVVFDFLGKDSVPYHNEMEVTPQVFKNLKIFKKPPKVTGDQIFDRLDPSILNKHLQNYMPGLTAKVFRTFNATHTMQQQLDLIPNKGTVAEKIVAYNSANRQVAILCNHQKAIGKTHETTIEKIEDKIKEYKWKRTILKKTMVAIDPNIKKKRKAYFEDMSEFTKAELVEIVKKFYEREKERWTKKFERMFERQKIEKVPVEDKVYQKDLKEKISGIKAQEKASLADVKSQKIEPKPSQTIEKLEAQVAKLDEQIKNTQLNLQDKEDNSQVALGTSKLNYIDPRLTVMFSKKYDVPIERLFGKSMREKFKWAIESADENWRF